ncbi:MAG: DUF5110 domain-containing protein [Muribaculaceae bacterium]|nr:DUF5110 domain-containing protein [Muribaculaceae bacterium]
MKKTWIIGGAAVCAGILAAVAGNVKVTPLTENIFKISVAGEESPATQAVVLEAEENVPVHSWVDIEGVTYVTPTTTVKVERGTGKVRFYNADGTLLLESAGPIDNASELKNLSFLMPEGALFYGAGERGHNTTLNGDSLTFYNRQNYAYVEGDPRLSQMGISIPWIVSDTGFGIFVDDYAKGSLELGDTITYKSATPRNLSYYFVNGDDMSDAVSGYTDLTGHQPLPPLWSLGYITSKYGYHTQAEAMGVIDTLKNHGYPVDGIVLDLYWYGKETDMGRLAWNTDQWPDHVGMLDSLRQLGVNTVLITQPYINKIGAIDNYNLLDSLGMLTKDAEGNTHDVTTWVGDAGMLDVANPATRAWLWSRLKPLTAEGVAGWWGDLGEPEVHPATIVHANGETAEEFHNVYGNVWSDLIYNGLRADYPELRPLLMMRGGTAGLQRYGVLPWTTDVSRSWGGFQPQIKLMLNSGLSGLGYMSSDIGGFAIEEAAPTDPELYVRWLQMGVFTPTLRTHAQALPEPYHYPEMEEISKRYIKMRYEWLPYNYTLSYENAAFGEPMARPLNFRGDNPGKKYADIADEYLWGDNVLVAPVMHQGAVSREVTFPAGTWLDFFNPRKKYRGGETVKVSAPLDKLPLFVKEGSFIPLYLQPIENVTQYNPADVTVRYYPSTEETSYTLFDDDRHSPNSLQDGAYQLTTFTGDRDGKYINIRLETDGGAYDRMADFRNVTLEVIYDKAPKSVTLGGDMQLPEGASPKAIRQYGWHYDRHDQTLTIKFPWDYNQTTVEIAY